MIFVLPAFALGAAWGWPCGVVAGLALRHWLDLIEIPPEHRPWALVKADLDALDGLVGIDRRETCTP